MALAAAKEMGRHRWWLSFGAQTLELQNIAVKVLSRLPQQDCTSATGQHFILLILKRVTDCHTLEL
jgi:hypothetical protein